MRNLFLKILLLVTFISSGQSIELLHQLKKGQQRSEKAQDLSDSFTTRVNTDSGISESTQGCFEGIAYTVDEASLVLSPAAFKASKLYSVEPTDGVGDFTVVRGSVATRINSAGLIEEMAANVPSLDYSIINGIVQSCSEMLLEPQSTNLLLRSEEFDNVVWTKNIATITINQKISPDGNLTADKIVFTTGETPFFDQDVNTGSTIASKTFTVSIYMYSDVAFETLFRIRGLGATQEAENIPISILIGWNRYVISKTFTASADGNSVKIAPLFQNNLSNKTLYLWGAQLKELPYATSYIKTEGSTVTRLADQVTGAGDVNTFNDSEGVFYINSQALFDTLTERVVSISDGTLDNRIYISYSTTTNQIIVDVVDGGVSQALMNYTLSDETNFSKIAVKWKVNDVALWVDGVERATDVSATMPSGLNELSFDDGNGANNFYARVKVLEVFETTLTDAQLEVLTRNLIPFILIGFKRRRKTQYKLAA